MAGAAVLATGCGDGQFGPVAATSSVNGSSPIVVKVASVSGLDSGALVQIPPRSALIAARKTGTNTFVAFSMICTHQGCETAITSSGLECPCHLAQYDSNGHVTRQPIGGSATNLPTYTAKYDAATDTLTIS